MFFLLIEQTSHFVRRDHRTQIIGTNLYLWAGDQPSIPRVHDSYEKKKLTSQIQIFSITSGKWETKPTKGDPPLGVSAYSCATQNEKIYYFGGWCLHDTCYHNSLNELDTSTLTWKTLSPTENARPVMKRCGSEMMLTEDGDVSCLLVIGGVGSQAQHSFGRECTDEQNIYNLSTGNKCSIDNNTKLLY